MKPLSFNISKMKKISGDKHSTTFKHPDGHTIRVAHAGLPLMQQKQLLKLPVHMDDGGKASAGSVLDDPDVQAQDPQVAASDATAEMDKIPQSMTPPQIPQVGAAAPPPAMNPVANPNQNTAAPANPNDVSNLNLNNVYQGGLNAIQEKQKAEGQLASSQADVEKQNQQQLVDAQYNWGQQQFNMQTDIANALEDVKNGHIDPKHYMENMDTPQKVATGIGLFLGGFSTPFTHQGNPALEFLNKQIDRDIQSQKDNQNTKLNVYNGYLNVYKNAATAENMARATQMAIYGSQIRQAADKIGTPLAKANADAATAQLQSQMIPLVRNAQLYNAVDKFGTGTGIAGTGSEAQYQTILNSAQQVNPELYKDAQSKYVPGVGVASHPMDPKDRDTLIQANELSPLIDRAIADQKNYGLTGAWSPKNRADANADAEALNVSLNKMTNLSRLNGVEYQNYAKQIGNIGGMNIGGTLETLKRLKQTADTERNVLMQGNGIKPFNGALAPSGLDPASQKNLTIFMMNNPGTDQGTAINFLRQKGLIN